MLRKSNSRLSSVYGGLSVLDKLKNLVKAVESYTRLCGPFFRLLVWPSFFRIVRRSVVLDILRWPPPVLSEYCCT